MTQHRIGVELRVKRDSGAAGGDPRDAASQVQFLLAKNDLATDRRKLVAFDQRALGRQVAQLDLDRGSVRFDGRRHQDMRSARSPVLDDSTLVHEAIYIRFG